MTKQLGRRWRPLVMRLGAVALATVLTIGVLELGLRVMRESGRFYPYYPNTETVVYPSPEIARGVTGAAYFTTNSFGCRGPELAGEQHRMLVVGGSTAACTLLDNGEEWPHLIMDRVNEHFHRKDYLWVTNAGMDGRNSRHHLMLAKYLVPKIPKLDHVLVYCGFNDIGMWLFQTDFDPHFMEKRENIEKMIATSFYFSNYTPDDAPWYTRFELSKKLSVLKWAYISRRTAARHEHDAIVEDERLEWLKRRRSDRQKRSIRDVDPKKMEKFDVGLDAYASNLETIIHHVRDAGAEPIFMAQEMQFDELNDQEERDFWLGSMDGGAGFAKMSQIQDFVRKYNARMEKVAKEQKVLFIDLPKLLEGRKDLFYDSVHFHEAGAQEVARLVSDVLIQNVYEPTAAKTAEHRQP
jgi:lysophospholipase L1-like esterase